MAKPKALSSAEVCRLTGITYAQLDFWCRQGHITPSVQNANGSGTQRRFSAADLPKIRTRKRLLDELRATAGTQA